MVRTRGRTSPSERRASADAPVRSGDRDAEGVPADLPDEPAPGRAAEADVDDADASSARSERASLVPADSLQRYLAEIRRIAVLSREEEHELAVQWHEHADRAAAWQLITSNLRLVVMIAREYQRAFHNLLDLVQEGNVGLLEAVKNFDPYRGIRFPSYAVWWVRAYIIRYIMNNWRLVKIGTTQAQRKLFFNLAKERERLEREGFSPVPKLIAQRLDVREKDVVEMEQRLAARDLSVDAPFEEGEESTLLDFLPGPAQTAEAVADQQYHRLIRETADEFRQTLKGKDLVIYQQRLEPLMRDEEPKTLQEIGDGFGITRERVRQIESRVKKRLAEFLRQRIPDIREIEFGA
jgi:RNA polymerase sigma-32 factor